jgi:hypothetical protein
MTNLKLPHRRQFLHLAAGAAALPTVSRIARAQPSSEVASPKKGTRVITLGTKNGPFPTAGRAQSSNLLVVNGAQYVIDAGEGVTRRLRGWTRTFAISTTFSSRIPTATIRADWEG